MAAFIAYFALSFLIFPPFLPRSGSLFIAKEISAAGEVGRKTAKRGWKKSPGPTLERRIKEKGMRSADNYFNLEESLLRSLPCWIFNIALNPCSPLL